MTASRAASVCKIKTPCETVDPPAERVSAVVERYWGYRTFRPLQREAMTAAVERRDSLVVLPTGGGKSLCYQAPALLNDRPTVVVSPLIALMKDQVDALLARDIHSAFYNSSLEAADRKRVIDGVAAGAFKLIFVAPERFAGDAFLDLLATSGVGAFAIDEAHCISHWGHDFRSDYRRLGLLKRRFGDASVHAFTATATPRVREDIAAQLGLVDPVVLVGDFFRPNLTYRVFRRGRGFTDVVDAVRDRPGKAGIVYCIRRADVDELSTTLQVEGIKAVGYHAGMTDEERTEAQDAFAAGKTDVVVATVAFGMGIDRADIRYVLHAAMPKSIEHYQQETGRAGRDGEPAECILFYTGGDFGLWQTIMDSGEATGPHRDEQMARLSEMYRFCTGASCRHAKLVRYFGQDWDRGNCGACDFCTGGMSPLADSTVLAQKILSCVARTGQRFGGAYVTDVLRGSATERIVERSHDQLSTFGLMPDQPKTVLMAWIDQLVDQELLEREGDYRVLRATAEGWSVMRGEAEAKLYDVARTKRSKKRSRRSRATSETPRRAEPDRHDADSVVLFGKLRELRRAIADARNVPAYVVFSDKTLREMARDRPTRTEEFLDINGVGPVKYESFGRQFMNVIRSHVGLPDLGEPDPSA